MSKTNITETALLLFRKRTTPKKRPPLDGEISANCCGEKGYPVVSASGPYCLQSRFYKPEPLLFHSSSSTVILTNLSGPRSALIASQKIWQRRETNPGPLGVWPGARTIRPLRRSLKCRVKLYGVFAAPCGIEGRYKAERLVHVTVRCTTPV
jgi:hypothetical protein